jgi:hypothetical protein
MQFEYGWREDEKFQWKCRSHEIGFAKRGMERCSRKRSYKARLRRARAGSACSRIADCERLVMHGFVSRLFTSAG